MNHTDAPQSNVTRLASFFPARVQAEKVDLPLPEAAGPVESAPPNGPTVMLEMRPALDGFAGIPQETRLLFRNLQMIDGIRVEGMIQSSNRRLSAGTRLHPRRWLPALPLKPGSQINRYSKFVLSLADRPHRMVFDSIHDYLSRRTRGTVLSLVTLLGMDRVPLSRFQSRFFEDWVWRGMFSKTLPAGDFAKVVKSDHRICTVPWSTMHDVGLRSLNVSPYPVYPRLDTRGVDVFLAQTPYPGRVTAGTQMVVRYHDAVPVFMPHVIADKAAHQATHFNALRSNVRNGAWFACISESTRQDLLKLFPEAAPRAVTIHNMVSHHYYSEPTERSLVPGIVRSRLNTGSAKTPDLTPKFLTLREKEAFYAKHLTPQMRYLIIVSTVEPRKNHGRLLAAWEVLKAEIDPDIKLIVVGSLGWDYDTTVSGFRPWIDRGELFVLSAVPAPDLRVLYQHATATVCPSLAEGFDYSGIEAMRSGGMVLASDIPVHREIYEDACEYFDPYATSSLVKALKRSIYDADAPTVRERLIARGQQVSERYLPARILPQWQAFLARLTRPGA